MSQHLHIVDPIRFLWACILAFVLGFEAGRWAASAWTRLQRMTRPGAPRPPFGGWLPPRAGFGRSAG